MAKRKGLLKSSYTGGDLSGPYRESVDDDVVQLPALLLSAYTVSGAPVGSAGQLAYFSNGDGGSPCLAMHDGATWRRIALGATISES